MLTASLEAIFDSLASVGVATVAIKVARATEIGHVGLSLKYIACCPYKTPN
jgi:hypothetical protein